MLSSRCNMLIFPVERPLGGFTGPEIDDILIEAVKEPRCGLRPQPRTFAGREAIEGWQYKRILVLNQ